MKRALIPIFCLGIACLVVAPLEPSCAQNAQVTEPPVLRSTIEKESPAPSGTPGTVESFFQITPSDAGETARLHQRESKSTNANPSLAHSLYRGVWHVLDNLGVPMFIGRDNDLDPSLRHGYISAPESPPLERIDAKSGQNNAPQLNAPSSGPNMEINEKIPESELEGTIYDSQEKHDANTTAP